jgi:hypothetical protein
MTNDETARRYADEALRPRKRGIGETIWHAKGAAAQIARGGLLAGVCAASVIAQALIPGRKYERPNTQIPRPSGRTERPNG